MSTKDAAAPADGTRRQPEPGEQSRQLSGPVSPPRVLWTNPTSTDALVSSDAICRAVRRLAPDARRTWVFNNQLASDAWWRGWLEHQQGAIGFVFGVANDWTIGRGVYRLVVDASRAGLPVWYAGLGPRLYPVAEVRIDVLAKPNTERFATVEVMSWPSGSL